MVTRLVKIYLVLSTVVLFILVLGDVRKALEHNPQGTYCDYYVEDHWANYVKRSGEQCRIRLWAIASEFGVLLLIAIGVVHSPAYLYFLVRHIRKRRAKPPR